MKRRWLDKNREKFWALCMELMFFDFNGKTRRFFARATSPPGPLTALVAGRFVSILCLLFFEATRTLQSKLC